MPGIDLSTLTAPELRQLMRLARGRRDGLLIDRVEWELAQRAALSSRVGFTVERKPTVLIEDGEVTIDEVRAFRRPEPGLPQRRPSRLPAVLGGAVAGSVLTVGAFAGVQGTDSWRLPSTIDIPALPLVTIAQRPEAPKPVARPVPATPASASDAVAGALAPEPFPPARLQVVEVDPVPPPPAIVEPPPAPVEVAQVEPAPEPKVEPKPEPKAEKVAKKPEPAKAKAKASKPKAAELAAKTASGAKAKAKSDAPKALAAKKDAKPKTALAANKVSDKSAKLTAKAEPKGKAAVTAKKKPPAATKLAANKPKAKAAPKRAAKASAKPAAVKTTLAKAAKPKPAVATKPKPKQVAAADDTIGTLLAKADSADAPSAARDAAQ